MSLLFNDVLQVPKELDEALIWEQTKNSSLAEPPRPAIMVGSPPLLHGENAWLLLLSLLLETLTTQDTKGGRSGIGITSRKVLTLNLVVST